MKNLTVLALFALCAAAQAATEIEAGVSYDDLDSGRSSWNSHYLRGAHDFAPRLTLYGELRETERFELDDTEISGGLYLPLSEAWTGLIEASLSDTHRVLAKNSVYGQLRRGFAGGWGLSAGLRHSEYTASATDLLVLGVERYWASWRAAYTFYSGRPEGAGSGAAHRVELHRFYGERSSIGVSVAKGREVENVGPPTGVITSDVTSLVLVGRHWISPEWAFSYELHRVEQGDLYNRNGLQLGIRYRF